MKHAINLRHNTQFPPHAKQPREPALSAKEVAAMFEYKTTNALHAAVSHGWFPAPDLVVESNNRSGKRVGWWPSTLEREKKRREKQ